MKQFLLRWVVNFFGLWAAATLVSGISYDRPSTLVWGALIFTVVNALVRPLVIILSLPAIVLTFGLFTFVVNALMLYLVDWMYDPLQIAGFGSALLAVLVIWLVNYLLSEFLDPKRAKPHPNS